MSRLALTTAAVAIAVVVAGTAFVVTRPTSNTGGTNSSHPSPSERPSGSPVLGSMKDEGTYTADATAFSQPFTVTLPKLPAALGTSILGDLLGNTNHNLRLRPQYGAVVIQDQAVLPADECHPEKGAISDVPATPQAVGTWLAKGLKVSSPVRLIVDGRVALRWDVYVPKTGCTLTDTPAGSPAAWFNPGEHHRVYAVPTGTDTILITTWGAGYQGEGEELLPQLNSWTDAFVRALHFG